MFIGHFAVGFAAKKFAPKTSLGTLFTSVQFLDLLWPVLLLLGIEHAAVEPGITKMVPLNLYDYPWSHSLLTSIVWGLIFGFIYFKKRKYKVGAIAIAIGVVSHWLLDLPMHSADLPLAPFTEGKYGLGLWNSPAATVGIELVLFIVGVWIYASKTQAKDAKGKYGLAGLVIFLLTISVMNAVTPPPPDIHTVAIVGNLQWLFVILGAWVDRHRAFRN